MRLWIRRKQSRPSNLNEAIKLAVQLEAYNGAEHKSHLRATIAGTGNNASDTSLSGMLSKFMEKFDNLQYYEKSEDILPSEAEQRCITTEIDR